MSERPASDAANLYEHVCVECDKVVRSPEPPGRGDFICGPHAASSLRCPKCASDDVATTFHRDRWLCNPHSRFTNNSAEGEHLHYTCRTCQFDWTGVGGYAVSAASESGGRRSSATRRSGQPSEQNTGLDSRRTETAGDMAPAARPTTANLQELALDVVVAARDLIENGWAMWEDDNPEVTKREDALIEAVGRYDGEVGQNG